jgi:hypothetical protein
MRSAISWSFLRSLAFSAPNHSAAWATENSATWLMCSLSSFTARASGFRRWPLQASQALLDWYLPRSSRTQSLSVSRQRRSMLGITPSKDFEVL